MNRSPAAGPLQCTFLRNPDRHCILTLAVLQTLMVFLVQGYVSTRDPD